MKSSTFVCPVPAEQVPINEYQDLRDSWFFRWAALDIAHYLRPIIILWGISWLVSGPVASASFTFSRHPILFLVAGTSGASVLPLLTVLRLYLGWNYVQSRLLKETIFYEESGWYDGQTWTKPEEIVQRDRLVVTYQIQPMLRRLKITLGVLTILFLTSIWVCIALS